MTTSTEAQRAAGKLTLQDDQRDQLAHRHRCIPEQVHKAIFGNLLDLQTNR